ncbi:nucleotide-binding universal stress UspA family protein [Tenacibaculum adriaticum]|uniref:Nucleotide-binding universal stress UspA family protein n=1 Tax=Tenacibaculum adriaticum TaxID=413713 RepID=A0A5S5DX23_9FLAO|nr:universal stress protein [Tenacibaculum adriaticum]TYQ00275.1 nucleotide-binding universal stress UspA family protein [Tenacibaculum adriaticum]
MKNILLLTDFSKASKNAMNYAMQLFIDNVCNIYLLHVTDFSTFLVDDLSSAESLASKIISNEKTDNKLKKIVTKLKSDFDTKNFTFNTITKYDHFIKVINELVDSKEIDLIVMGSNGITGAEEIVFGSNTINVVRKVKCTTLVIPEHYEFTKPKEVLIPLAQNDSIASNSFIEAKVFLEAFLDKLHFLRINSDKESSETKKDKEHLIHLLNDKRYVYSKINNVPLHYAVSTYTQLNNVNLITLITHEETIFERLFYSSEKTKLSNYNLLPLLVFHSK